MRTTCINHPPKQRFINVQEWQVDACDGNVCAAALLSFFEYWHNIKLGQATKAGEANDVAERHGEPRSQDESLTQWHSGQQLSDGLLGLYQTKKIAESIDLLVSKGFIRVFRNPNPRYKFDATKHFVFEDGKVNEWLETRFGENAKPVERKSPTVERNDATVGPKGEISIEAYTTSNTTSKTNPPTPQGVVEEEAEPEVSSKPNGNGSVYTPDFETFWTVYPRKIGKGQAFQEWKRVKARPSVDKLVAAVGIAARCQQWQKDGGQYIPHPSTWLHQRRWDDQPMAVPAKPVRRTSEDYPDQWYNPNSSHTVF